MLRRPNELYIIRMGHMYYHFTSSSDPYNMLGLYEENVFLGRNVEHLLLLLGSYKYDVIKLIIVYIHVTVVKG